MLLRRVIDHVRAQNWTAVGLDFLIVVVGVFVGLQVSNWNDARSDRVYADNALERLEMDFQRILARTDRSLSLHEDNLAAVTRLIVGSRSGTFNAESINEDMKLASNFATPPGPSTTFRELVAGGRLGLITSNELSQALYEYDDYVTLVRDQYGYFTEPLMDARKTLLRARQLSVSGRPSAEIIDTWATEKVDTIMLASDVEVATALQAAYGTQDNILAVLRGNRQRIQNILDLIGRERQSA